MTQELQRGESRWGTAGEPRKGVRFSFEVFASLVMSEERCGEKGRWSAGPDELESQGSCFRHTSEVTLLQGVVSRGGIRGDLHLRDRLI